MSSSGTTTVNFGSFPGSSHATVAVTGQASIGSSSLVEAWIFPSATADHTSDEHLVEKIRVVAADVIAGTGFTIHAFNTNEIREPLNVPGNASGRVHRAHTTAGNNTKGAGDQMPSVGGALPMPYGQFTVAWVWN